MTYESQTTPKYPNFNTPYEAGYDAAEQGASVRNCHFGFFSTPERTKEWERGNDDAKEALCQKKQ